MASKLIERETYAYLANHLKLEADRLAAAAYAQITRLEEAIGKPEEAGIRHLVERELEEIQRLFTRAQMTAVPASDRRHAAARSLLEATAGSVNRTPLPDRGERVRAA